VSQSVCHTKRVERSTYRNLPPIFTKLATKVESQEVLFLVEIRNISIRQTGSGINPHLDAYLASTHAVAMTDSVTFDVVHQAFDNVKYLENGERHDVRFNGSRIVNHPWVTDWNHDL